MISAVPILIEHCISSVLPDETLLSVLETVIGA